MGAAEDYSCFVLALNAGRDQLITCLRLADDIYIVLCVLNHSLRASL